MKPQRFAVLTVLCGALVLDGWVAVELAGLASPGIGAPTSLDTPQATATAADEAAAPVFEAAWTARVGAVLPDPRELLPPEAPPAQIASASTADPVPDAVAAAPPVGVAETASIGAALPDPREMLPPETPPTQIASASTADPVRDDVEAAPHVGVAETASVGAASPVPTALASTPDPVPDEVEAAPPPVEVAEAGSGGAALPDSREMPPSATPPVQIAAANTPDPVRDDVEAAPPRVEVAEPASAAAASPDPREVLPPATLSVQVASASTPDPVRDDVQAAPSAVEVAEPASAGADSSDSREMPPSATPPVRLVSLFRSEPVTENLTPAVRVVETPNECLVVEICIDEYLWSFYERTPKVDTNKVTARVKAMVKKKGKTRTVTKTVTRYVVADFAWKDPIAAQRAGMSIKDYVIGGMDRGFKLRLYRALRAMDDAGLMPGITSAFRDDYRQAIASGNKAASDSSYHGGSRRGGYGHGLAADLVSVKGETRLQRWGSTVELWKWVDAHEKELGIGRPYLDRDPPHVGPVDGKEYADKRGRAKAKLAGSATHGRHLVVVGDNQGAMKRAAKLRSLKVGSI